MQVRDHIEPGFQCQFVLLTAMSRSTESEKRAATTIAVNTGAQKLGAWFFGQYQHLADPKDFANYLRPLLGH